MARALWGLGSESALIRLRLDLGKSAREYAFHRAEISIGRSPINDLSVPVEGVSARHGRLRFVEGRWRFQDLDSLHGTQLLRAGTARPLDEREALVEEGDVLLLGGVAQMALLEMNDSAALGDALVHVPFEPFEVATPSLESFEPTAVQALAALSLAQISAPNTTSLVRKASELMGQVIGLNVSGAGLMRHGGGPLRLLWLDANADKLKGAALSLTSDDRLRLTELAVQPGLLHHPISQEGSGQTRLMIAAFTEHALHAFCLVVDVETSALTAKQEQMACALGQALRPILLGLAREKNSLDRVEAVRAENRYFRERQRRHYLFKELVTESAAMRRVYERLGELVERPGPVVLVGEAGTGKELIARAVHHLSERSDHMMVTQRCAGQDSAMLDLELFGAGAAGRAAQLGVLELAEGGTVFLNEIEHLPQLLQARLLRVIKEGEVRRHGEEVARHVDVRLVLATHKDLAQLVAQGSLRRELHAALQDQVLFVPPLRQRVEDIEPLAKIFLQIFARRYGVEAPALAPETVAVLKSHLWPGNVRELQTLVEAALLRCKDGVLLPSHFGMGNGEAV